MPSYKCLVVCSGAFVVVRLCVRLCSSLSIGIEVKIRDQAQRWANGPPTLTPLAQFWSLSRSHNPWRTLQVHPRRDNGVSDCSRAAIPHLVSRRSLVGRLPHIRCAGPSRGPETSAADQVALVEVTPSVGS